MTTLFFIFQTSLIFDIKLKEPDSAVNIHQPVLPAQSIHPYKISVTGASSVYIHTYICGLFLVKINVAIMPLISKYLVHHMICSWLT